MNYSPKKTLFCPDDGQPLSWSPQKLAWVCRCGYWEPDDAETRWRCPCGSWNRNPFANCRWCGEKRLDPEMEPPESSCPVCHHPMEKVALHLGWHYGKKYYATHYVCVDCRLDWVMPELDQPPKTGATCDMGTYHE